MKKMYSKEELENIIQTILNDLEIDSSKIDSGEATSGQVLTADGSGGASWEDASGGDEVHLYEHQITLTKSSSPSAYIYTIVVSKQATAMSISQFVSLLSESKIREATGFYNYNSRAMTIVGLTTDSYGDIGINYFDSSLTSESIHKYNNLNTSFTIQDNVKTIL